MKTKKTGHTPMDQAEIDRIKARIENAHRRYYEAYDSMERILNGLKRTKGRWAEWCEKTGTVEDASVGDFLA